MRSNLKVIHRRLSPIVRIEFLIVKMNEIRSRKDDLLLAKAKQNSNQNVVLLFST